MDICVGEGEWKSFSNELENFSSEQLFFYPQRAFTFSVGEIIVDQNLCNVGTTVWDAEVMKLNYVGRLVNMSYMSS